jgi:regulation of enolase protein 1 (concanavalin A-like superfamily)
LVTVALGAFVAHATAARAFDSDDFDRPNLDPARWTLVDPLGDGWVTMLGSGSGDAQLELSVPEGPTHDPYHTNRSLRVMQPIADADFQLEAKFQSDPAVRYQLQGFIVEEDDQNWLRFDTYHDGSSQKIFAAVTVGGSSSSRFNASIAAGAARFLRVTRIGNDWTLEIAGEDAVYSVAGGFTHALAVSAAGVFVANHASSGLSPAYTAVVDWVADTASPIVDEDVSADPDTLPPLIQNPQVGTNASGLVVSWFTDEPCLGTVDHGTSTAYELGPVSDAGGLTFHSVELPGLVLGQTYHYRIGCADALSQSSQTGDFEIVFDPQGPEISVWYGESQAFGQLGQPQPWVNVLGNVSDPDGIADLEYSLNAGPPVSLSVGPDGRRLVGTGDFNVDLDVADLQSGANSLVVTASDGLGNGSSVMLDIDYWAGTQWPLPVSVDWSALASDDEIQDVGQVVDGKWSLDNGMVRTVEPGYDRLLAIGDRTWTDYDVTVPIVLNAPASGHGFGVLMRWDGHTDTPVVCGQPKCGYLPLGGILWARPGRIEVFGNGGTIYDSTSRSLATGVIYWFKGRVETQPQGSLYRLKVWEDGSPEPAAWDIEGQGLPSDPQQGSLLLISHQADVSFGNVLVEELAPPANFPPIANDDTAFVAPGDSVMIPVLANDTDSDGTLDPASVALQTPPSHGTALPDPGTGSFLYTHDGSPTTSDSFTYVVDDALGETSNAATVSVTVTQTPPLGIVSDDFNRPALDPVLWTIDDPTGDGAHAILGAGSGDARLALSMPAGTPHNAWGAGGINETIRAMQSTPDTDFELEVKWNTEPAGGYNDQGILVEQDADNWLRFDVFHSNSSLRLFVGKTIGGSNTAILNANIPSGSAFYLRVRRQGDTWTTWTSGDGVSWQLRNSFDQVLTATRVGVYAGNPIDALPFTSEVDYFFNSALPVANEDANTITVEIVGEGSVLRSPDLAEYVLDDVVQLDALAAAGSTFVAWSGDLAGEEDPALLTVTGAMRVTATFATTVQVPGLGPSGLALAVALLGVTAVRSVRRRTAGRASFPS